MEKTDLSGYLEFASRLRNHVIKADIEKLIQAADESAIHTFGWPIGPVLHVEDLKPKPYSQNGIRAIIEGGERFDYWTLDRNGDYYILMSLFEDRKLDNKIFIDTRTVRTTELLLRTGRLYRALDVPDDVMLETSIEYGGLEGRVLSVASQRRDMSYDRKCSVDVINTSFSEPLNHYLMLEKLKEMVFEVLKNVTEMCDGFVPSKAEFSDPIVEAYYEGRII